MLLVVLGGLLAGFVLGLTGSNFGLVAMAFWTWALEPMVMAPLIVCASIAGHVLAAGRLPWRRVRQWLLPLLAGGLIGTPVGVWLLHVIDRQHFTLGVGMLLTLWCSLMLLAPRLPHITWGGRRATAAVGVVGGLLGGLGGIPGPAPALWAVLKGWDRDTQRTVVQGFNLAIQIATLVVMLGAGTLTSEVVSLLPWVLVCVVPAALAGMWLYRRLSDVTFTRTVLGLLALSGVILVALSLAQLP